MALIDLIQTSVSLSAASVAQANFGKPIILSNGDNSASWGSAVYREYSSPAGVLADFPASSGTYLMASQIFSQDPTVPLVGVGLRATSSTTQTFYMDEFGTSIAGAGTVLTFTVNGNSFTYTTVSGDSTHDTFITNIVAALVAASWYGASGITITADSTNGAGHHLVKFVCTAAKINDIVIATTMLNYLILYQAQGVAGSGGSSTQVLLAADLAAIANQNNTWYTILSPFVSAIEAMAIAKYAQANVKTAILATSDSNCVQIAASADLALAATTPAPTFPPVTSTAASIMALLAEATYTRTMCIYTQTIEDFKDGGWAGSKLWTTPGSEMWAYTTIDGASATILTETERNVVVGTFGAPSAKWGNVYESVGGVNITELGVTSGQQFFDNIRFLDWVNATIQSTILQAFINASNSGTKIPYTQAGIVMICGLILGVLKQGVINGGFSSGVIPIVPVPQIGNISLANLTARNLPNIGWQATLASAIQEAGVVGNVTV